MGFDDDAGTCDAPVRLHTEPAFNESSHAMPSIFSTGDGIYCAQYRYNALKPPPPSQAEDSKMRCVTTPLDLTAWDAPFTQPCDDTAEMQFIPLQDGRVVGLCKNISTFMYRVEADGTFPPLEEQMFILGSGHAQGALDFVPPGVTDACDRDAQPPIQGGMFTKTTAYETDDSPPELLLNWGWGTNNANLCLNLRHYGDDSQFLHAMSTPVYDFSTFTALGGVDAASTLNCTPWVENSCDGEHNSGGLISAQFNGDGDGFPGVYQFAVTDDIRMTEDHLCIKNANPGDAEENRIWCFIENSQWTDGDIAPGDRVWEGPSPNCTNCGDLTVISFIQGATSKFVTKIADVAGKGSNDVKGIPVAHVFPDGTPCVWAGVEGEMQRFCASDGLGDDPSDWVPTVLSVNTNDAPFLASGFVAPGDRNTVWVQWHDRSVNPGGRLWGHRTTYPFDMGEWLFVGDEGNPATTDAKELDNADQRQGDGVTLSFGHGAVADPYFIRKTEVTVSEYADFLNATSVQDDFDITGATYFSNTILTGAPRIYGWRNNAAQITRSGTEDNWSYAPVPGLENVAANFTQMCSAMRMANWIHNGRPTDGDQTPSTTEDGAYDFTDVEFDTRTFNAGVVNHSTDTISDAGHVWETGDGPLRFRKADDGSLPGWARRQSGRLHCSWG